MDKAERSGYNSVTWIARMPRCALQWEQVRAKSYLALKLAFYSGKAGGRTFVAMVGNSVEDQELKAAPEFISRALLLSVLPDQITEDAAKQLTAGRQMLRLTYNFFVWWLD